MTEDFNFEASVREALREALKERGYVNILIAGRTGVGKSTLINAIFQGNLATTGQGRPVTQNTREIKKEDIPISIFDTRGLEMADFSQTIGALRSFVSERSRDTDPKNISMLPGFASLKICVVLNQPKKNWSKCWLTICLSLQ